MEGNFSPPGADWLCRVPVVTAGPPTGGAEGGLRERARR